MKTKSSLSWRGALVAIGSLMVGADFAIGQSWTLTSAPITNWTSVASSADGTKLVAAAGWNDNQSGGIFVSTNSGAAWQPTTAPAQLWLSVASSADGNRLIAASPSWPAGIFISDNPGADWIPAGVTTSNNNNWAGVCLSANGSKVAAADKGGGHYPSRLFVSTNSGVTWAERLVSFTIPASALSSSADGAKWLCTPFYVSNDCGQTWEPTAPSWLSAVASSSDGLKCIGGTRGVIYSSTNSGVTWTSTSSPEVDWTGVASSADGTRLVAVANSVVGSGPIYTSTNSGIDWTVASAPMTNWSAIASSADGSKLVAVINGGGIYTWQTTPTPVLNITPSGSNLLISWTVPSLNFALQQNTNLNATSWVDVPTAPTLNTSNLQDQVTLPATNGMIFYRLAAAQRPD